MLVFQYNLSSCNSIQIILLHFEYTAIKCNKGRVEYCIPKGSNKSDIQHSSVQNVLLELYVSLQIRHHSYVIRDRPIILKQVPIFLFLNSPVFILLFLNSPYYSYKYSTSNNRILQTFTSAFGLSPRVLVIATYLTNSDNFQTLYSLQLDHSSHRSHH